MYPFRRKSCVTFVAAFAVLPMSSPISGSKIDNPCVATIRDLVELPGLPTIGKWMVDQDGEVAHWLGYRWKDRQIDEPINVIIRIGAPTAEAAGAKLLETAGKAGFLNRSGHSSGYSAFLGAEFVPQFPDTPQHAFSNHHSFLPNDHGRVFGPVYWNGYYYFIAAFSRESIDIFGKPAGPAHPKPLHHVYSSFNFARDRFAQKMERRGGAHIFGYVKMDNAIRAGSETTGDHDGSAIIIDL